MSELSDQGPTESSPEVAERPDVRLEEGSPTFRASALGDCARGLVAARLGIRPQPPAGFLQKALEESKVAEGIVINELHHKGITIVGQQDSVFLDLPAGRISGHIEGHVADQDSFIEIKALGRTLFGKFMRGGIDALGLPFSRKYKMQISAYMYALDKPCILHVYGKEHGFSLEKRFEEPPNHINELNDRMAFVNDHAARQEYPECDAGCSSKSFYWFMHRAKPVARLDDVEMVNKVAKAKRLKETIKSLEDEYKTISDEVKSQLGSGAHAIGPFKVSIIHKLQTRTDLDKLRRDMGEEFLAGYQYETKQISMIVREGKGSE